MYSANTPVEEEEDVSFMSNILTPGSSLHPTFLLVVDCAFTLLLFVFMVLAFLTAGSVHVFALMVIELCLWGSVKWFVNELKQTPNAVKCEEVVETKKDI